jgi:hypothetical protein
MSAALTRGYIVARRCALPGAARARLDLVYSPPSAAELISLGWQATYADLFGWSFVASLGPHHREAIKWHWDSRLAFLTGGHPEHLAYFPIWSRGHMKSTVAERMVVVDAFLSAFFDQPGFCLYVCRNKPKTHEHVSNVEKLLSSAPVRRHFPALSEVKRNEETNQRRQWTGTFLHTMANYVVKGGSLDSAQAGSRIEETRPTFIVPDDIDGREDSEVISKSRFRQLTTEILPMRQGNTLTFFAQNLISRYSTMYRIWKQHARVLTNRKPTDPVPAVLNLKTETRTVGGIVKDVYLSGEPTWKVWDARRIQDEIDSYGLPAFLRECQHEVEQSKEGLVLYNWDDKAHAISESEFEAKFGTRRPPQRWWKYVANDWARTKTQLHANVALTVTVSGQFEKMPGCHFLFDVMSFEARTEPENVALRIIKSICPVPGRGMTWDAMQSDAFRRANLDAYVSDANRLLVERRAALSRVIPTYVTPILRAQNYVKFRGSHEQSNDALRVYKECFGLPFVGTNPGADGGMDFVNSLMRVDYSQPHAFRPGEMGYTRFYLIVPDDREAGPLYVTPEGVEVYPPKKMPFALSPESLHDTDLARHQFASYRYPDPKLTEAGEVEGKPIKADDDIPNGMMMLYHDHAVQPAPLNHGERVIEALPEKVQPAAIEAEADPHERAKLMTAQVAHRMVVEKKMQPRPRGGVAAWRNMGKDKRR